MAGNGERGFDGDGGPATQAQLVSPLDVTLDEAGNIYIAAGFRVRKITVRVGQNAILNAFGAPDGIIQTIAGGGSFSGDGRLATEVQIGQVLGVAVDRSGKVYITGGSRVHLLTPIPFQLVPRFRFPVP